MSCALITGITGQDGSYLAEQLLDRGYRIIGAVRSVSKAAAALPQTLAGNVELVAWDMSSQPAMAAVLAASRPSEIYNYAAYSSGAGMFDDPVGIGDVNGLAVARLLEAIREVDSDIRFCQASSSEMFGEAPEIPQSESTSFWPRSPYGAAKLYAHSMIHVYRQTYGLFACSAILFNHESPRRGPGFVTRKVSRTAAMIKLGIEKELHLGNLDAQRDWGFAGDYVRAMWMMLTQPQPDDYVIATGVAHTVRKLCECAFGYLGLDYRDYVRVDASVYRKSEPVTLLGNADKARRQLGWVPQISFEDLVHMMVDADMKELKAHV